jgi:DNA-binding response OmpR family regulator
MDRILVVDDDSHLQKALKRLFEFEGYEVAVCGDGGSALEAFRRAPPTAIVLDLHLPVIPGIEVCRKIREESIAVPIVILSAETDVSAKISLLEAGADDYVTKPFSSRELVARVRTAIRHAPRLGVHDVATFNGVRVDFTSMDVTLDHRPVALTRVELKMLKVLVKKPGRVVSHHELSWEALGPSADESAHSVGTYIYHLRHKLERDDAVGTPLAVQQKLMRHADIRTTMNIYGDVVTDEMAQAHSKVVQMALPKVN